MKVYLHRLIVLLIMSTLFTTVCYTQTAPALTDAQKQARLEKFMDDNGFNGDYTLRWGTNDLDFMYGTFTDSSFTLKSYRMNYRKIADKLVYRLLPCLGIPAQQVKFDRLDTSDPAHVSVWYYQIIDGYILDTTLDALQVKFTNYSRLHIDIHNGLACLDGVKKRIKVSKSQAISLAVASLRKSAKETGWSIRAYTPATAALHNERISHKDTSYYILCWKVNYGDCLVYVNVKDGTIVFQDMGIGIVP